MAKRRKIRGNNAWRRNSGNSRNKWRSISDSSGYREEKPSNAAIFITFIIPDEANSVGKASEEWLEGIKREFRYFRITEAIDKKDAIIIYGGKEIARLEKSLPDPEVGDVYLKLRNKLNDLFSPKKNKHHASTPWGNFRPKRLVFGAKASQDVFDEAMYKIFGDIPRCLNQRDDILIGANNWKERNETLESVFQKAEDYGITFNEPKCEFGQKQITFYGYQFGQGGLRPTPEKVQAINECKPPQSKTSFLGMSGYLSKFIPRYDLLTKPLRELTHKETKFHWGRDEDDAFEELKSSIFSKDTMTFFNPKLPIMMRVEASYNEGLSAGLFQQSTRD
ncbi:hypothetical protein ACROYT_G035708 [Oculina patagonica]